MRFPPRRAIIMIYELVFLIINCYFSDNKISLASWQTTNSDDSEKPPILSEEISIFTAKQRDTAFVYIFCGELVTRRPIE